METAPPIPGAEPGLSPTSLWSRLMNVFAAPGEVFEEIKSRAPATGNWLAPTLVLIVMAVISSFVIFSQPSITQQIRDQQQKAFDKQVAAGKMTQAQADQAAAMAEKFSGPTMLKVFGSVGAVIASFASLFWWAFLLWLIARFFLKVPVGFMKTLEVTGLASMISVLAAVIKTLLIILTGKTFAAVSLILLVENFDPRNLLHNLLALTDVMTFWVLAVRSIGLAKLTGATFGKTAAAVFAVWLVISGLMIGFSLAVQAIFSR